MTEVVEKWSGGKKSFFGRQLDFFFLILVETDRFLSLLKRCLCVNQIYLLTRGVFFLLTGIGWDFFFICICAFNMHQGRCETDRLVYISVFKFDENCKMTLEKYSWAIFFRWSNCLPLRALQITKKMK